MLVNNDLGAALYKTWTKEQRRDEIERLVQGYRAGLPVGILCKMSETIAGSRSAAKKHLIKLMTLQERKAAVETATGGMEPLLRSFLL